MPIRECWCSTVFKCLAGGQINFINIHAVKTGTSSDYYLLFRGEEGRIDVENFPTAFPENPRISGTTRPTEVVWPIRSRCRIKSYCLYLKVQCRCNLMRVTTLLLRR